MAATSRPLARVPSASDKPPLPPVDVPQDAATTAAGDEAQTPAPSAAVADDADVRPAAPLPRRSLFQLALQHALSSWGTRSYEFAAPLFFIHAYSASLLAASLYGCLTTLAAILLAGSAGRLVDVYAARKRAMLRGAVAVQSVALAAAYALFATLLNVDHLGRNAENAGTGPERGSPNADVWTLFAAITAVGCVVT
jgi:iron-regulated transporter 1